MSANSEKILKVLLWWQAIFHTGLGLFGIFAKGSTVFVAGKVFNFNLELTPQMSWVIDPFAAYLLGFGGFMAVAALDPSRHKSVIYVGAGLLAIRVLQRVIFVFTAPDDLVADGSRVSSVLTIVVVSVIVSALIVLTRKLK